MISSKPDLDDTLGVAAYNSALTDSDRGGQPLGWYPHAAQLRKAALQDFGKDAFYDRYAHYRDLFEKDIAGPERELFDWRTHKPSWMKEDS